MDAFVTRRKRKSGSDVEPTDTGNEDSTDVKLAMLSSLHPHLDQEALLDILLAHDGSVDDASASLKAPGRPRKGSGVMGAQVSLRLLLRPAPAATACLPRPRRKRGSSRRRGQRFTSLTRRTSVSTRHVPSYITFSPKTWPMISSEKCWTNPSRLRRSRSSSSITSCRARTPQVSTSEMLTRWSGRSSTTYTMELGSRSVPSTPLLPFALFISKQRQILSSLLALRDDRPPD